MSDIQIPLKFLNKCVSSIIQSPPIFFPLFCFPRGFPRPLLCGLHAGALCCVWKATTCVFDSKRTTRCSQPLLIVLVCQTMTMACQISCVCVNHWVALCLVKDSKLNRKAKSYQAGLLFARPFLIGNVKNKLMDFILLLICSLKC